MSQLANITKMLAVALAGVVAGCSTTTPSAAPERSALMRIRHCAGDVVPLCAAVKVYEDEVIEYARNGNRVLRGRLADRTAEEMQQLLSTLRVSSWPTTSDPVGSFVTFNVGEDSRTVVLRDIPPDAVAVLQLIDREGHRLFGSAYRSILPPR